MDISKGLLTGTVKQISNDPDSSYRINVSILGLDGKETASWARLSNFYATNGAGQGFLPEINDEVIVGFIANNPESPIILGSLYSKNVKPLNTPADEKNNIKTISTRSQLKITFDDDKKTLKIETPGGNSIFLNDDGKTIEIVDQNSNSIKMTPEGIALNSNKDLTLNATGNIFLNATGKFDIKAEQDISLSGMNIENTAKQSFTAKGTASAELSATGQTTIKGAMVMIN